MYLGFGEVMMRVAPRGHYRLAQVLPGSVETTFAGAEANVCVSLSMLGAQARYLTMLPQNMLGDSVIGNLRGLGVDVSAIRRRGDGRLGVYYVETGANQRGSTVTYDRDYSAISLAGPEEYDFDAALEGIRRVHATGITPSLSEKAYRATLGLVRRAKERGCQVSCDLNYRKKLWRWRPGTAPNLLARECMTEVLKSVDLLIANEEDAADVLDIHATGTDVEKGQLNIAGYEQVAREITARFPNIGRVAVTLRESKSADHNNWGGMLFDARANSAVYAPLDGAGKYAPYEIRDIVDRVGGGDSFAAGLLFALETPELAEPQKTLHFAVAASCLKHSVIGDFNFTSRAEVEALMGGAAAGRVRR
jgi:2-dehydro-3-deoxygluconokinase